MIITQERTPIIGRPGIWQVLVEYEHLDKHPVLLTGFRLNWIGSPTESRSSSQCVPLEVVYKSENDRQLLYQAAEPLNRCWDHERYLESYTHVQNGDVVLVRGMFPEPISQAHVVLF